MVHIPEWILKYGYSTLNNLVYMQRGVQTQRLSVVPSRTPTFFFCFFFFFLMEKYNKNNTHKRQRQRAATNKSSKLINSYSRTPTVMRSPLLFQSKTFIDQHCFAHRDCWKIETKQKCSQYSPICLFTRQYAPSKRHNK